MNSSAEIRLWCDGCYDVFHFGHANQLRRAKAMGDILVVGVHSDEDISHHKGPPVFNDEERIAIIRSVRWVDELVEGSSYFPTEENTLDKYNCQFCVHGDDISVAADGTDTLGHLKAIGRYKEFPRTAGISTTALLGRILSRMEDSNFKQNDNSPWTLANDSTELPMDYIEYFADKIIHYGEELENDINQPFVGKTIYVSGYFDLFHIGHLRFLEAASKLGDNLIVGVYGDEEGEETNFFDESNHCKGLEPQLRPIMTVNERALALFTFRQVSKVIIGVPRCINADFIQRFGIDLVARGKKARFNNCQRGIDCMAVTQEMGILRELDSGSTVTTQTIIERILRRVTDYERRNNKKQLKEIAAFQALQKLKLNGKI